MAVKASDTITLIRVDDGAKGDDAILVSKTAPPNPTLGQLWQTESGQPIKIWDGTKWALYYISAQNLEVDKLSAITADLGDVTLGNVGGWKVGEQGIYNDKLGYDKHSAGLVNSDKGTIFLYAGELTYDDVVEGMKNGSDDSRIKVFITTQGYMRLMGDLYVNGNLMVGGNISGLPRPRQIGATIARDYTKVATINVQDYTSFILQSCAQDGRVLASIEIFTSQIVYGRAGVCIAAYAREPNNYSAYAYFLNDGSLYLSGISNFDKAIMWGRPK